MGLRMRYKIARGNEEISSTGGISLVGGIIRGMKMFGRISQLTMGGVKKGWMSHGDILKCMVALLCEGRTDYADINSHKGDVVFMESLDIKNVPSEERLRQRIEAAAETLTNEVLDGNLELLAEFGDFGRESTAHNKYTPVDMDVSPMDNGGSRKEGVGRTYKGCDGYAPMFAYIGTSGHMLDAELRPGTQHSQKDMDKFLTGVIDRIDYLGVDDALCILDSAHDASVNIDIFQKRGVRFLIKRNPRFESPEQWLALGRRVGDAHSPRPGKTVFTGAASHIRPPNCESDEPLFVIFEVTERTIDANGDPLLIPDVKVDTWWTNLTDSPEEIIQLYHNHGTSEQFHSELKSDMGFERLPSGKFKTNALLLQLAMIAFNILRIMGQEALKLVDVIPVKVNVARRRLRSVIQDLVYIACKRVSHANAVFLKFGRNCPWFGVFRCLYLKLC